MESKRQQKFSKLIQKDLADIFQKDARHFFGNTFITVTHVTMSPDLGFAKVFLSFLLTNDKKASLEQVNERKKDIRRILGNKIAKQVRVIPELAFFLDDSAEYASHMDKVISGLDIPPPSEDQDKDQDDKN
jgi:ribosome-binding factor A